MTSYLAVSSRPIARFAAATLLSLLAVLSAPPPAAAVTYASRITTANGIGLTVTNHGFLGNNFVNRTPSLEYPLGSAIEHLPKGGLWIGAHAQDDLGTFVGVSTASLDVSQGWSSAGMSEFLPLDDAVRERSNLPASPFYSPLAVSEQDFVASFVDSGVVRAFGNGEDHRGLGVRVRQETYAWTFDDLQHVLFVRYVIHARQAPLSNVWIGISTEFASGDKNAYSCWPPSAACSPYGGWYSRKWVVYEEPLRLLREHYCVATPMPLACQAQRAPYWIALELLTPPAAGQRVTLGVWNWSPSDPARDQDVERYALMSAGTITDPAQFEFWPTVGDPVELLALGPFATLNPGDSVVVDFAFLGAPDEESLRDRARLAQRTHDLGYPSDIATPVAASLVESIAEPDRVRLVWHTPDGPGVPARIERRDPGADWRTLARVVSDGAGRWRFEDAEVVPGLRYDYRLAFEGPSGTVHAGETAVDVPARTALALLESRLDGAGLAVRFGAPRAGRVRLEVLDVSGRRLAARDLVAVSAGEHAARLEVPGLAPGLYFVRLAQDGARVTGRAALWR
jgi:hypothetical protein